jgi:hypothetical protein
MDNVWIGESVRTVRLARQAVVVATVAAIGAFGAAMSPAATAAVPVGTSAPVPHSTGPAGLISGPAIARLPVGEEHVCPAPARPGQMECMSIIDSRSAGMAAGTAGTVYGYGPSDLRSAYKIRSAAARNGGGKTIAIVDAFSDPRAVANLATYRAHFRLGACSIASRCLRIVNEFGKSRLPAANSDWAAEESLDLDMVSATCPRCQILLVEARTNTTVALGTAEDTAVAMGARYVSNSWSGPESVGQDSGNHYFNHPGDVIDFASGDFGYGATYPADLQYVTAVGGTTLRRTGHGRGWTESVWGSSGLPAQQGTGSGCSAMEPKPSWQRADARTPGGCLNRTENDVAAVANPGTGVAIYDTYHIGAGGWLLFGGTSAATPIITAIYALAGTPSRGSYPAQYPYLHTTHLFDVRSGSNGRCESDRQYLCNGGPGYDGPTGLGTPDGIAAFSSGSAHRVTLIDPGTQDRRAGAGFAVTITGLDTRRGATLRFSASNLPHGLSIRAIARSTDGRITGFLPTGTFNVTVTARDGRTTGVTHFTIVGTPSLTASAPRAGALKLESGVFCLDDNGGTDGSSALIRPCDQGSGQQWAYVSDGRPDGIGALKINGLCLNLTASGGVLAACSGSAGERFAYPNIGPVGPLLELPATGRCLAALNLTAGSGVHAAGCNGGSAQGWTLPAAPFIAAVGADCMDDPGDSGSVGTQVKIATCRSGATEQQFTAGPAGLIEGPGSLCLSTHGSLLDGAAIDLEDCDSGSFSQVWQLTADGQIVNANSGRCLSDPGDGSAGTRLVQEDCYGQAGEIWAIN